MTVLELVLVMAIVVILAAIAIPRSLQAVREAKEAKLLACLHELRTGINRFTADCGGYPEQLKYLVKTRPPRYCRNALDGSRMDVDPETYRGPYVATPDEELIADPVTGSDDWVYDPTEGTVRSKALGVSLDGSSYSDW